MLSNKECILCIMNYLKKRKQSIEKYFKIKKLGKLVFLLYNIEKLEGRAI